LHRGYAPVVAQVYQPASLGAIFAPAKLVKFCGGCVGPWRALVLSHLVLLKGCQCSENVILSQPQRRRIWDGPHP
jgi:hypothetical protein